MPGPMVLLYHRVTNLQDDPNLLSVTPEHFEEHLLTLRRHFRVVSLSELTKDLVQGVRIGPDVAITFDDGYYDNAEMALPLLEKYGLPATFFLSAGFVEDDREKMHDELERLLLQSLPYPDHVDLTIGGQSFFWDLRSDETRDNNLALGSGWSVESKIDPSPRHRAYREIHDLLRPLSHGARKKALEDLRCQCGDPGLPRTTHRSMSWSQVQQLVASEVVEVGAHTMHHSTLSALSLEEQYSETCLCT